MPILDWLTMNMPLLEGEPGGAGGTGEEEPPDPPVEPAPSPEGEPQTDFEKEAAKWKALARKHEAQAKANAEAAEKLSELENAGKSETEKLEAALNEYKAKAREATVKALKLQIAGEKGLTAQQAKFLPDVDNEVDMMQEADEILEAFGIAGKVDPPTRQPKSNLNTPLSDGSDTDQSRESLISAMLGKPSR